MAAVKTENGLTDKQEKFCQVFVEINNASEAYRQSYDTSEMMDKTVWEAASRLQGNSKVASRINELRAEHKERHNVTVDSITRELEEARVMAMEEKQASAATGASMGKAKLHGLITDKTDNKTMVKTQIITTELTLEEATRAYQEMIKGND